MAYLSNIPSNIPAMTPAEILALRHELGWTQATLAQYFKVTPRTVAYWERTREQGGLPPNDFQLAALKVLKMRLEQERNKGLQESFQQGLQDQLPAIVFGAGVVALLLYLASQDDPPKKSTRRK